MQYGCSFIPFPSLPTAMLCEIEYSKQPEIVMRTILANSSSDVLQKAWLDFIKLCRQLGPNSLLQLFTLWARDNGISPIKWSQSMLSKSLAQKADSLSNLTVIHVLPMCVLPTFSSIEYSPTPYFCGSE